MENASPSREGKRPYHSRARQRQAEETRQRILAATRDLFASRGYAGTTLEAVAQIAEVSPKTVSARTFSNSSTNFARPRNRHGGSRSSLKLPARPTSHLSLSLNCCGLPVL